MTEQNNNLCKRCGLTYAACKYPVSHAHPTIENVSEVQPSFNGREEILPGDYKVVGDRIVDRGDWRRWGVDWSLVISTSDGRIRPPKCGSAECRYRAPREVSSAY